MNEAHLDSTYRFDRSNLVNRGDAMGGAHGFTRIAIFRVSLGWHHVRASVGPGVAEELLRPMGSVQIVAVLAL